ncbi:hypothetical protein [Burkholderia pseudomallei]|uniref:hypothetical protein n=1 Tax=Burkholderia pseudomallei TaxID=28450 RepID=UPI0012AEB592|nr:hypothetical protein [Burkholderia pseudomallei]
MSTGTPAIAATAAGAPFSTRSLRPAPAAAFRAGDPARRVERRESHDARAPERRRTTRGARAASRIAASTACVAPSALASAARASTSSSLASGAATRTASLRIAS